MSNEITPEEVQTLEACTNEEAWNAACSEIKRARGGGYPTDWWPKVKMSGMMARITARFGKDDKLHMAVPDASSPTGWTTKDIG